MHLFLVNFRLEFKPELHVFNEMLIQCLIIFKQPVQEAISMNLVVSWVYEVFSVYEPGHEKTFFLHMGKQRCRSAAQ